MTPVEILTRARALIERPEAWTQGAYAKIGQIDAELFEPHDCRCSLGALFLAAGKFADDLIDDAAHFLAAAVGRKYSDPGDVVDWNDHPDRTHAEVLDAFDRAIELARAGCEQ